MKSKQLHNVSIQNANDLKFVFTIGVNKIILTSKKKSSLKNKYGKNCYVDHLNLCLRMSSNNKTCIYIYILTYLHVFLQIKAINKTINKLKTNICVISRNI